MNHINDRLMIKSDLLSVAHIYMDTKTVNIDMCSLQQLIDNAVTKAMDAHNARVAVLENQLFKELVRVDELEEKVSAMLERSYVTHTAVSVLRSTEKMLDGTLFKERVRVDELEDKVSDMLERSYVTHTAVSVLRSREKMFDTTLYKEKIRVDEVEESVSSLNATVHELASQLAALRAAMRQQKHHM